MRSSTGAARILILIVLAVIVVFVLIGYSLFNHVSRRNIPVDYANDVDHFKYGSIGSDSLQGRGMPYWIWKAMPEVCSDLLPGGYTSLGFVQEPGMDRPIGFSKRRTGFVDSVGPNCGSCHTATVRVTPTSPPLVYLAASAHQLDLLGYFNFLFTCGQDSRFTPANVMGAIKKMTHMRLIDRIIYKTAIKKTREQLLSMAQKLTWISKRPVWGPGRVDTFNPYKSLIFNLDMTNDDTIGTADYMVVWNQQLRAGHWVHWDGNNNSVDERNLSAAMGAGASPQSLDLERIERVKAWIWTLKSPAYPFGINQSLAARGKPIYQQKCAYCHEPGGVNFLQVIKTDQVGTDPERVNAFDEAMANRMNTIGQGYPWHFQHFRSTGGYVSDALDGAWLRAPYLHNGSVPTLRDLLEAPEKRPVVFYRGYDVFDKQKVGFVSNVSEGSGRKYFKYDTTLRGNHNGGHPYGSELLPRDKDALVEYLKTL